jgi:hypothetical protein
MLFHNELIKLVSRTAKVAKKRRPHHTVILFVSLTRILYCKDFQPKYVQKSVMTLFGPDHCIFNELV